jgi:hypothetical protein
MAVESKTAATKADAGQKMVSTISVQMREVTDDGA